jgi:ubiquinone/menaquinone biosynthesis C-methylase UbiE
MIKRIKINIRKLQEFLERHFLGSFIHKVAWKFRHLYKKSWNKDYLNSVDRTHRVKISQTIASFQDVNKVLDVGCAVGANLLKLREYLPKAKLTGVDINASAIKFAKIHFASVKDNNVAFKVKDLTKFKDFNDNEFDVIFTDAVLMFIAPSDIDNVIKDFIRIAKKGIVLNEYHQEGLEDGYFDGGRWVYDYIGLFAKHCPNAKVEIEKSVFSGGSWDTYGSLIKINL